MTTRPLLWIDPTVTDELKVRARKERLRAMYSHRGDGIPTQFVNPDGPEAADRIQSDAKLIAELREALIALADGAEKCTKPPHYIVQPFLAIFKRHGKVIDKVRAALNKERIGG